VSGDSLAQASESAHADLAGGEDKTALYFLTAAPADVMERHLGKHANEI